MSSGFGSNIKDQIISSNRSRPRVVGSSSGYGQQIKKKQSSSSYEQNARGKYQQRSPPRLAEANEPQRGKIKAFIDLDAIPDECDNDTNQISAYAGGRVAAHQSNFHQQEPSSLYQPHSCNSMYGVRDAYKESPSNSYMAEYKSSPISEMDRRGMNIIPKMGAMRAMQPDATMQKQAQQHQSPTSSRKTPPPPLPADRPMSSGNRSKYSFPPNSPEDRERRRLVNQVRVGTRPGSGNRSRNNSKGGIQGVYGGSSEKRNYYDDYNDDDDWGDYDEYDDGNYANGDDVNRYSQYDYEGNSDYDAGMICIFTSTSIYIDLCVITVFFFYLLVYRRWRWLRQGVVCSAC